MCIDTPARAKPLVSASAEQHQGRTPKFFLLRHPSVISSDCDGGWSRILQSRQNFFDLEARTTRHRECVSNRQKYIWRWGLIGLASNSVSMGTDATGFHLLAGWSYHRLQCLEVLLDWKLQPVVAEVLGGKGPREGEDRGGVRERTHTRRAQLAVTRRRGKASTWSGLEDRIGPCSILDGVITLSSGKVKNESSKSFRQRRREVRNVLLVLYIDENSDQFSFCVFTFLTFLGNRRTIATK